MALASSNTESLPPNPPPLPPSRINLLQRITAPFNLGIRSQGSHTIQSNVVSPRDVSTGPIHKQISPQTTAYRTGIPIAAVDINKDRTQAILAGQEILKTVRIHECKTVEVFNLRSAINSQASTYGPRTDAVNHRREFLPAKDVRWSHGPRYDTVIATAALNGRVALYDVNHINSSRVELSWLHDHTGQVNKLDFDPFGGYLLLSGSQDKTVRVWDIREPKFAFTKTSIPVRHPVRDLKWSPTDAGEFALCTENGVVQHWDLRKTAQALLSINAAHEKACYTIDWHPDGRHLMSGGFDKMVKVWNLKSDNRKPKPSFSFKTPQAVMNLRWRPPSWSMDLAENRHWQSTQIATSYRNEDPRVHVWDLRRPWLPLRELDRYNSQPTDLIWASEDFLWTVGNEGMFLQTDMRFVTQLQEDLPTCTADFMPDGSFMAFAEDMRESTDNSFENSPSSFPGLAGERLSGATDDGVSQSFSDDEVDESPFLTHTRRRRSKATSSRSAKSQGTTPANMDTLPPVVSLTQSIPTSLDFFDHNQAGSMVKVEGIAAEPHVVQFLAENYAQPSTADERKRNPNAILSRLEAAFLRNAAVCDHVAKHRMAQSWRILGTVVVSELTDWAEQNRKARLDREKKEKVQTAAPGHLSRPRRSSSVARRPIRDPEPTISQRPQKVLSNLFKGVVSSEVLGGEAESTSNMTTPLAMPLPDSPPPPKQDDHHYIGLSEIIEPMPPLPPSVMSSHSTAAAASKALLDDDDDDDDGDDDNAGQSGVRTKPPVPRSDSTPQRRHEHFIPTHAAKPTDRPHSDGNPTAPTSTSRTQEDRRAAIKDYRAQARPLFTLETPVTAPNYPAKVHHDSADSFPMFSVSTDGSKKEHLFVDSFESRPGQSRTRHDSEDWQHVQSRESFDSSPPSGSSGNPPQRERAQQGEHTGRKDSLDFALDDAPGFSFGADGKAPLAPLSKQKATASAKLWALDNTKSPNRQPEPATVASSASDTMFHFEQVLTAPRHKIFNSNPIRNMASGTETSALQSLAKQDLDIKDEDVDSRGFVYSDFRPIDFTTYEPRLPFAWSALPLICHSVAFDVQEGIACAQFSVHLLSHVHPFFFNQAFRSALAGRRAPPDILAERLMRPDLGHRIVEGLLLNHTAYLKSMSLFGPMTEFKNLCVELDYPAVSNFGHPDSIMGSSLQQDPFQLQVSCGRCDTLTPAANTTCATCQRNRQFCPICQAMESVPLVREHNDRFGPGSKLWTYCPACGHGAHMACMQEWLLQTDSEGECPCYGCGCDCGPGLRRSQRIARQTMDAANNEMIRGPRNSFGITKKDPLRANPSPAVEKTRETLRYADLQDRGTQSSDEARRHSMGGRGGNRGGNGGGSSRSNGFRGAKDSPGGRRVRLVTPGEQSSTSHSRS